MNDVYISDHLRKIYEFNHWLRNKKWWRAIFLYAMEALLTNAYLVYCSVMDEAGAERAQTTTPYQFLLCVAVPWIDLREPDIRDVVKASAKHQKTAAEALALAFAASAIANNASPMPMTPTPTALPETTKTSTPSTRSQVQQWPEATCPSPMPKKAQPSTQQMATPPPSFIPSPPKKIMAPKLTDKVLLPEGSMRVRLNHFDGFHCPEIPQSTKDHTKSTAKCALHRWISDRKWQYTDGVYRCSICQVHLCIPCFKLFHEKRDLVEKKAILKAEMEEHWKERPRSRS